MRARGLIGVTLGIATLLALLPTAAALASPHTRRRQTVIPASRYTSFQLRGTNGFLVSVSTVGTGHLAVELFSGPDYVSYLAPAKIEGNDVGAKIGGVGQIAMQYRPSGPWRKSTEPQGQCRGRRPLFQRGVLVGRFSFRGERGFTAAKTKRVSAYREESFREVCKGGGRNGFAEQPPLKPDVTATATRAHREISVELFLKPEELSTHANVREERGGLVIERSIGIAGEGSRYAEQTDGSARITPPPPFHGEVEYRPASLGGDPWTGTLSAPFPGLGLVRLAGEHFAVSR